MGMTHRVIRNGEDQRSVLLLITALQSLARFSWLLANIRPQHTRVCTIQRPNHARKPTTQCIKGSVSRQQHLGVLLKDRHLTCTKPHQVRMYQDHEYQFVPLATHLP
jgi:hypothetical protein